MNPPSALFGAMNRERKPFTYTPGGLDLSEIKSERMAKRLMRNAMNQGVPDLPQQLQSPPATSTPIAVPNFNCLPVQVFPTFNLPANPKSLLRTRSNPEHPKGPVKPIPPPSQTTFNNNILSGTQTQHGTPCLPQVNTSYVPQTNVSQNRPASTYVNNSFLNTVPRTNYGSNGSSEAILPPISYEAEYFQTPIKRNNDISVTIPDNIGPTPIKVNNDSKQLLLQNEDISIPVNSNTNISVAIPEIIEGIPKLSSIINDNSKPINIRDETLVTLLKKNDDISKDSSTNVDDSERTSVLDEKLFTPIKKKNDVSLALPEKEYDITAPMNKDDNEQLLVEDKNLYIDLDIQPISITPVPRESIPVEDEVTSDSEQRQVKVVKKQVKKEQKIENGEQNGDSNVEAELVVKLPAKKSAAKTETKVEVHKTVLPDGTVEEVKVTTTKTTIDGRTEIKTKTEKKTIPKEQVEEEEVEEEEEQEESEAVAQEVEETVEEPVVVVNKSVKETPVVENGQKETIITKKESSESTTTKKVVVVQKEESEEEEEEEEEEPEEKPASPKPEIKEEADNESEEKEEDEEVDESKEEVEQEEVTVTVKKNETLKQEKEEVEEEYEEAEEEKVEKKQEKVETKEEESKDAEDESEYTEEEYESENEEAPVKEPEPKPKEEEPKEAKSEPEVEAKEEEIVEKAQEEATEAEPRQEKQEEPAPQSDPVPEPKVPLKEPSIPLEKVEEVEIKPIGAASEVISKSHTQNTEIITNTSQKPIGPLSTQTEYSRVENIVTVNRTTKALDHSYEQMTQQGIPTVRTYFAPSRERVPTSPTPAKPYQPVYAPEPPTERRHSLLLDRLSTERQIPSSDIYQNTYQNTYNNQSYEQQRQWSQEPQSEVLTVSNVKPSKITNSQWYQQNQNVIYNNVTPSAGVPPPAPTPAPVSQAWNQPSPQPQPQPQQQYQSSYIDSTVQERTLPNTYQPTNYSTSYTPRPSNWANDLPSVNTNQYSFVNKDTTENYQKSTQQYSSSYVPPPWEQDSQHYVLENNNQNYYQPPPQSNNYTPSPNQGWKPTPPPNKFTKPPPTAYIPPAPNQSFVKSNVIETQRQPGRKTYYSEYERRYITVPESTYIPGETAKFQPQPDPSPQYYYDNNEATEKVEHEWRKELREFTEKTTSQTTEQSSVKPPWEDDAKYVKNQPSTYTPTPTWSQTLRPQSWRERSFESEYVGYQQPPKTNTLGRGRPLSTYAKTEAPAPDRSRGVSVDRYNPNYYQSPIPAEHPPVPTHTLAPTPAAKAYHNPNVPAYHAHPRASAEPREQSVPYPQARLWGTDARGSPVQSRSFKYLQWITGTEN